MKRLLVFVFLLLLATVALVSTPLAEEPRSEGRYIYTQQGYQFCEYHPYYNECWGGG